MSKRTPWFPADVCPVREGNYEGEIEKHGIRFHIYPIRWMKGEWHVYLGANSGYEVWMLAQRDAVRSLFRWRGLTRPTEEA